MSGLYIADKRLVRIPSYREHRPDDTWRLSAISPVGIACGHDIFTHGASTHALAGALP